MNGKSIYPRCCNLRIQFSQLEDLNVKQNNEKSRDFTVAKQDESPTQSISNDMMKPRVMDQRAPSVPSQPKYPAGIPQNVMYPQHFPQNIKSSSSSVLIVSGLPDNVSPDNLFTLFCVYGNVIRVKILYSKKNTALIQFASIPQAFVSPFFLLFIHCYSFIILEPLLCTI